MAKPKKTDEEKAAEKAAKEEAKQAKLAAEEAEKLASAEEKSSEELDQPGVEEDAQVSEAKAEKGPVDLVASDKVKVISQVNMVCLDGTRLVIGQEALLPKAEWKRLKADKRGPFFKE